MINVDLYMCARCPCDHQVYIIWEKGNRYQPHLLHAIKIMFYYIPFLVNMDDLRL